MISRTWFVSHWDRLAAVISTVAGVVVLVLGWQGVSQSALPAGQIPYVISAGLGGMFLLGVAGTLWLSADLRDEWHKLDRLERALEAAETRSPAS